jgi:hypothetical protein
MLSSVSVKCVDRSIKSQVCLGEGQDFGQKTQNNDPYLINKYTLTIFAPNNLYLPAILRCKTREEFLKWLHITRRCGYFHEQSQNGRSHNCRGRVAGGGQSKDRTRDRTTQRHLNR